MILCEKCYGDGHCITELWTNQEEHWALVLTDTFVLLFCFLGIAERSLADSLWCLSYMLWALRACLSNTWSLLWWQTISVTWLHASALHLGYTGCTGTVSSLITRISVLVCGIIDIIRPFLFKWTVVTILNSMKLSLVDCSFFLLMLLLTFQDCYCLWFYTLFCLYFIKAVFVGGRDS